MTTDDLASLSDAEIKSTIEGLQAELARRSNVQHPVRVSVQFSAYNARRYSRPWIARVSAWPVGGKATLEWGAYCGDDSGGEVEIMAKPGDIIRYGQKDTRGNNGSADWAIAQSDGSIQPVTEPEARKTYQGGN